MKVCKISVNYQDDPIFCEKYEIIKDKNILVVYNTIELESESIRSDLSKFKQFEFTKNVISIKNYGGWHKYETYTYDVISKNSINIMLDKVNQIIDDYEYDFESKDETKSESIKNKLNEDIKYINNNTLTKIINEVNKGRKEFLQGWFSLVYNKFIKKYNVDLMTVNEIEELKTYLTKLENNEIESISYYYIQNNFIEESSV